METEGAWIYYRWEKTLRGGRTVWYRTCGPFSLTVPPNSLAAKVDDIFIHHDHSLRATMWVYDTSRRWTALKPGDAQPSDLERKLALILTRMETRAG